MSWLMMYLSSSSREATLSIKNGPEPTWNVFCTTHGHVERVGSGKRLLRASFKAPLRSLFKPEAPDKGGLPQQPPHLHSSIGTPSWWHLPHQWTARRPHELHQGNLLRELGHLACWLPREYALPWAIIERLQPPSGHQSHQTVPPYLIEQCDACAPHRAEAPRNAEATPSLGSITGSNLSQHKCFKIHLRQWHRTQKPDELEPHHRWQHLAHHGRFTFKRHDKLPYTIEKPKKGPPKHGAIHEPTTHYLLAVSV